MFPLTLLERSVLKVPLVQIPVISPSMASPLFASVILGISFWVLLVSPAHSQNCSSQKFSGNRVFANCSDLSTLSAVLHYNYNASNASLSIAFTASPSKPDGWVAWAINPNGTGMIGAQALIAFKLDNKLTVKTYNLESYKSIKQEKLSFDVWDLSAEENNGTMTIFAGVKLPGKSENVSQVWQVGPSVTQGHPDRHDLKPVNLASKGPLALGTTSANTSGSSNTTGNNGSGGNSVNSGRFGVGLCTGLLLLLSNFL